MNTVLDRLTDAMSAAASTVRDEELRPLTMPKRRWRQLPWVAPLAAAAAVVLVIGLAVSASNGLFGTHRFAGPALLPAAPHRFYLSTDLGTWKTVVRSTATGKVIAVVPVPSLAVEGETVSPALASAGNGTFYIAAFERGVRSEQIYRFRLTAAGHVDGVCPGNRRLAAPRVGRGCAGGIARRLAGRGRRLLLPLPRAVRAATIRPAHRDRHRHRGAEHVAGRVARPRVYLLPRRQPVLDRRAP